MFALFAELEQGRFPRVLAEEIGNVPHSASVFLGDILVAAGILVVGVGQSRRGVVRAGDAVVVLLLGRRSGRSYLLCMLVVRWLRV